MKLKLKKPLPEVYPDTPAKTMPEYPDTTKSNDHMYPDTLNPHMPEYPDTHLSKRQLIENTLRLYPDTSNRAIAKRLGVSHGWVNRIRRELYPESPEAFTIRIGDEIASRNLTRDQAATLLDDIWSYLYPDTGQ